MLLFLRRSHRLMARTSPFHGGNMGSNPVGITISNGRYKNCRFSFANQALNRVRMFVFWKCHFGRIFRTRLMIILYFSIVCLSWNLAWVSGLSFIKSRIWSLPKIKVFDVDDDLFLLLNFFLLKQHLFKKSHFLTSPYNAWDRKWLQPFLVGYVFTTYDIAKSKVILIYFGLYVFLNLDNIR